MPRDPGTGLERATKSIPLSGGMTEEVDDFLLEPGGMQYMENLRFTKSDLAVKARGRSTGVATGVTNHTDNAYGVWSQGDTVAVVANKQIGLSRDAGASFDIFNQPTDLMGIESILRTAEASGGNNYSWAPLFNYVSSGNTSYAISGYVVAFERVTHVSGSIDNTRQCVVQIYDAEGQLNEETVFNNRGAPKVHPNPARVIVNMVGGGTIYSYEVLESGLVLGSLIDSHTPGVQDYCQVYNDTGTGYGNIGNTRERNSMRLGYTVDLQDNNWAFDAYGTMDSIVGAQAWKNGAGDIEAVLTAYGQAVGSGTVINSDSATLFGKLLDVFVNDTYVYVLYSTTLNAPVSEGSQTAVLCTQLTTSLTTPLTFEFQTGIDAEAINGSVRTDSFGHVHIAVTYAEGSPTETQYTTQGRHRVAWWQFQDISWPAPSTINSGQLYSHRLCSDLVIGGSDYAFACVQQWDNWNPGRGGKTPYEGNVPAFTPTHKKPVTTSLICLSDVSHDNKVIATFDAGQSKSCLAGSDEQSMHMSGDLYFFDATGGDTLRHQFWYGNRVLLGATDDFYNLHSDSDHAGTTSDARASLHPGSARFSCYKLSSDIRVNTESFTNGMFLGTSCPTWYDGSTTLCSVQPIESPEVVGWDDITPADKDMGSYGAYQDLVAANESAKVVNLVAGYYDDSGLIHRSAPSLDFYIGRTKASETDGTAIRVWFTPPLGLARGRNYFVEIYEAWPGGVGQLAATRQLSSNDGSTVQYIDWATNLSPYSTKDLDVVDYRSAKTIYTAGNVLAADPWPNFDLVVRSGRRLFAHSISDPATIFYSKTFESGVAPEFSASLAVSIGNEKITAMGAIDDKVIIFSATGCWVMYGTGPDNTGANGDFFIEQMVFPVGCTDQQSIVTMQDGIAFYSSTTEEFHLFTRDLQLVDIGESVKTISENITDVVSSLVVPNDHELRWYCTRTVGDEYVADSATDSPAQPPRPFLENQAPAGSIFVYNYKYKKWSIIEDGSSRTERTVMIGCCVGELAADWDLYKESTTTFDKLCKWETPWIKVNQLQDFGRFYGLTVLGKYMSSWSGSPLEAGDLQVTIRYDYEGALGTTDVHRIRANVDLDPADGDRLQFRLRPKRQKCQAIKLQIEEVATTAVELWEPTYTTGEGFVLTAVDVHYGAKGGSGDKSLGAPRRKG